MWFADQAAKLRKTLLRNLKKGHGGSTVNLIFAIISVMTTPTSLSWDLFVLGMLQTGGKKMLLAPENLQDK